jgi:hypothetical protein
LWLVTAAGVGLFLRWLNLVEVGFGAAHAALLRVKFHHTDEFDSSKDGGKQAGPQPPVRVSHLAVLLPKVQGRSHISVAALLQVCLRKQALHLPAFGLLLTFDLVERELKCAAGGQPGLEKSELDCGRRGAGGICPQIRQRVTKSPSL